MIFSLQNESDSVLKKKNCSKHKYDIDSDTPVSHWKTNQKMFKPKKTINKKLKCNQKHAQNAFTMKNQRQTWQPQKSLLGKKGYQVWAHMATFFLTQFFVHLLQPHFLLQKHVHSCRTPDFLQNGFLQNVFFWRKNTFTFTTFFENSVLEAPYFIGEMPTGTHFSPIQITQKHVAGTNYKMDQPYIKQKISTTK